jgi:hypothetical protein
MKEQMELIMELNAFIARQAMAFNLIQELINKEKGKLK